MYGAITLALLARRMKAERVSYDVMTPSAAARHSRSYQLEACNPLGN